MAEDEPNFLGLFSRERNLKTLKAGDVLFKKGEPASSMFVVLYGEIGIGHNSGTETVSAGGIVGEMALIDQGPRSATATALSDASLAEIDEKRFLFLVREIPSFALNGMRLLSHRLRRSNSLTSA